MFLNSFLLILYYTLSSALTACTLINTVIEEPLKVVADGEQHHSSLGSRMKKEEALAYEGMKRKYLSGLISPTSEHIFSCTLSLACDVLAAHTQTELGKALSYPHSRFFQCVLIKNDLFDLAQVGQILI